MLLYHLNNLIVFALFYLTHLIIQQFNLNFGLNDKHYSLI